MDKKCGATKMFSFFSNFFASHIVQIEKLQSSMPA